MSLLNIDNVHINAESFRFASISSIENVVAIFVTPPNSYSAVKDPIDLICSRGGDLTMLEMLTESEMNDKGKNRVTKILEEQIESLVLSMTIPQVQLLIYETHSIVDAENSGMVKQAISRINNLAKMKHKRDLNFKENVNDLATFQVERLDMFKRNSNEGFCSSEEGITSDSDITVNLNSDVDSSAIRVKEYLTIF